MAVCVFSCTTANTFAPADFDFEVRPAAEIDALFAIDPTNPGQDVWMGGDVDTSVAMDNHTLWLFGDTWIGRFNASSNQRVKSGVHMPHSTVALQASSNSTPTFYWKLDEDGRPTSMFTPPSPSSFSYWVVAGIQSGAEGGTNPPPSGNKGPLLLLATRYNIAAGKIVVNGTTALVVDTPAGNPTTWAYRTKDFPVSWLDIVLDSQRHIDFLLRVLSLCALASVQGGMGVSSCGSRASWAQMTQQPHLWYTSWV
jgi:hypothetical protein